MPVPVIVILITVTVVTIVQSITNLLMRCIYASFSVLSYEEMGNRTKFQAFIFA